MSGRTDSAAQGRVEEGWFGPGGSRKYHYFVGSDLRSLCGKWMLWAHPEDAGMEWGDAQDLGMQGDCAACSRKLAAREAKANG